MTPVLGFETRAERVAGRALRRARFEPRSALPVSAACLVANGVRESLAALLRVPVALHMQQPVLPDRGGWERITAGALLFAVRGTLCDAAFVLRPPDALALAAAAFGESEVEQRDLSALERRALEQTLAAAGGSLAALCGPEISAVVPADAMAGYTTYFELRLERPSRLRLGVAISREPASRGGGALTLGNLGDVPLELRVEFARGRIDAGAFLTLRPGTIVPMMTRMDEPGLLKLGSATIGRGECGALRERSAMCLQRTWTKE